MEDKSKSIMIGSCAGSIIGFAIFYLLLCLRVFRLIGVNDFARPENISNLTRSLRGGFA